MCVLHTIEYNTLYVHFAHIYWIQVGVPLLRAKYTKTLSEMDVRIRLEGLEDQVTDTVLRVTGRAPRSLEQFITAHKASFPATVPVN